MKILFVANFLPDTNYTRDLSTALNSVIPESDVQYLCGRKHEPVTDGLQPAVDQVWEKGFLFFIPILKYIRLKKPDVVHVQHEFRNYGWTSSAIMFPWFIFLLHILGYTTVVTLHGVVSQKQLDQNFLEGFGFSDNPIYRFIIRVFLHYVYRLIYLFSDYCTVHTDVLMNILISEYGFRRNHVGVIPHGVREIGNVKVKPKHYRIYGKFPRLRNKKIILVFGYFSPRKGYEYLIRSFRSFRDLRGANRDWVLVLAGDVLKEFRYYKHKISRLISDLHLNSSVFITGYVDRRDIDDLYRLTKIVVIPAVYSFNTSGALSIALAYKKPILVSNVKPLADEITSNRFGMLYDKDGKHSFFTQLNTLTTDQKTYRAMESSLTDSVQKRYWRIVAKKHYALYKRLTGGSHS